jgi:long-chain fatty acid transport protein
MVSASRRLLTIAVLGCLLTPAQVSAEAFRILDHGAAATGQGAAFAAQADDPSALYYNPAGMTQLPGFQLMVGTNLVSSQTTFTPTVGRTVEGGTSDTVAIPPPTQFYLTAALGDLGIAALRDLTVGIGVTSPFGLLIEYPNSGSLATVITSAALPLLDIKPTMGYRVTNWLSVGAGIDIYTFSSAIGDGHAELKRLAGPELAPFGIPTGAVLETNGTDTAVGFNLAVLVTPLRHDVTKKPLVNVALVYRSPTTLDLSGKFLVNDRPAADAEIRLKLPWVLTGGVAGWPVRDQRREWKLEVDVDYADWSRFDNLDVHLSTGVTLPFPRNWGTSYVVMAGTEYRWLQIDALPGWELSARAGYFHSATPVPERTFEPAVPDADYNAFSVGAGFQCRRPARFLGVIPCPRGNGDRGFIAVDLAYQVLLFDSRRISNNGDPRVNGNWETTTHVGALSLRVSF